MLDKNGKELQVGDKVKVCIYFKGYVMEIQQGKVDMALVDVVRKTKKGYKTKWEGFYTSDETKKVDWN